MRVGLCQVIKSRKTYNDKHNKYKENSLLSPGPCASSIVGSYASLSACLHICLLLLIMMN